MDKDQRNTYEASEKFKSWRCERTYFKKLIDKLGFELEKNPASLEAMRLLSLSSKQSERIIVLKKEQKKSLRKFKEINGIGGKF